MNEGRDVLGCLRVAEAAVAPIKGATKDFCVDCGAEVWVAPSSLQLLAKYQLEIVCTACEPPVKPDDLTDEQKEEVRANMDKDPRRELIADIFDDRERTLKVITAAVAVVSMHSRIDEERERRGVKEIPEEVLRAAWQSTSLVLAMAVAGEDILEQALRRAASGGDSE